jgi:hypothetical protein
MSRLLKAKRLKTFALLLSGVHVLFAGGCGMVQHYDEDHAIGAMETIRKAEVAFKSQNDHYGTLDELAASHFWIPSRVQNNYEFRVEVTETSYVALAVPLRWKGTSLSLYLDQSGIIRGMFKNGAEADVKDPPLRGYGINPSLTPLPLQ